MSSAETAPAHFHGQRYRPFNHTLRTPAVAHLNALPDDILTRLRGGASIKLSSISGIAGPQVLKGTVDFLASQGYLSLDQSMQGELHASAEGHDLLQKADLLTLTTSTYSHIAQTLERAVKNGQAPVLPVAEASGAIATWDQKVLDGYAGFSPAFLFNIPVDRHGTTVGELLKSGEVLVTTKLPARSKEALKSWIPCLLRLGFLIPTAEGYAATRDFVALLRLVGYSRLEVSYAHPYEHLTDLTLGHATYALGHVYRNGILNALASNEILKIKVAPKIIQMIREIPLLQKYSGATSGVIDFGSGGGDMLMIAAKGLPTVKHFMGQDFNPEAIATAQRQVKAGGLDQKVQLMQGDITNPDNLVALKKQLQVKGVKKFLATINFILHDIGPMLARKFLEAYAEIFGHAPLVLTETLKIPLDVLVSHPDYQAASFQYMHDISGQHLFEVSALKDLLLSAGYVVKHSVVHSQMPGREEGERLDTIVTWVVQYQG